MKKISFPRGLGRRMKKGFRQGNATMAAVLLFTAILVTVNLIVQKLPASWRSLDLSESGIYTLSDQTQQVLAELQTPIILHVIAEPDTIDQRLTTFLDHVDSQSDQISVEVIDPVLHPSVLSQYGTEADTLVVENGQTQDTQIISFDDILIYDEMLYYYYVTKNVTSFDGEGQLISAIRALTQQSEFQIVLTSGHDEAQLSDSVSDLLKKAGYATTTVNLLSEGGIPLDCDLLLINAPQKDLSEDELTLIREAMQTGGHVMILLDGTVSELPRIQSLLEEYGLQLQSGIVGDLERYYQNNAAVFFPMLDSAHSITSGMDSDNDLVLLMNSLGMSEGTPQRESITVTPFMTTSGNGVCFDEDSETEGQFIVGATAEEVTDETVGTLTVISSSSMISSQITDRFSNLANLEVFMNAVSWNLGEQTQTVVAAKSLSVSYNIVQNAGIWSLIMIAVIPLTLLGGGLIVWLRRRRA